MKLESNTSNKNKRHWSIEKDPQEKRRKNTSDPTKVATLKNAIQMDHNKFLLSVIAVCLDARYYSLYVTVLEGLITEVSSFDRRLYVSKIFYKKLKSNKVLCQAVLSKLEIFDLPKEYLDIKILEKVLIAKRLLFRKINIMPKYQFLQIEGEIYKVPIDTVHVSSVLV